MKDSDERLQKQLQLEAASLLVRLRRCYYNLIRHYVLVKHRKDILCEFVLKYHIYPHQRRFLDYQQSRNSGMILAFRGAAKSTYAVKADAIFRALAFPNERSLIISSNHDQAAKILNGIKEHFENNKEFLKIFGDLKGPRWSATEIMVKHRTTTLFDEATITVAGVKSKRIVGMHVENLYFDDVVSTENARTLRQREALKEFVGQNVMPTLMPNGRFWVVGTRYSPEDYYSELMSKTFPDYLRIPMIYEEDGVEKSTWEKCEDSYSEMELGFTIEECQDLRAQRGMVIFNLQYQNLGEIFEGAIFHLDWFDLYEGDPPENSRIFISIDPALGQNAKSDWFAVVIAAVTPTREVYIKDYIRARLTFPEQIVKISSLIALYEPMAVFIESVAFQGAIAQTLRENPKMKRIIKPMQPRHDKVWRAHNIAPKVVHNVWVPDSFRERKTRFLEEAVRFPDIDHDDVIDAFIQLMEGVFISTKTKRPNEPGLLR